MKRTLYLLILFALLLGVWLIYNKKSQNKSTISLEDREFITKDKTKIGTITLQSKGRPMIHLHRKGKKWLLNNKYIAKKNIVDNMLGTLTNMTIDYIPTSAENETAKKRMDQHGIEVTTFDDSGKVLTDFILGTNTNDEYGTYCLKKGAHQSYVMRLPVFEGGIREYFNQTELEFRDLTIIDLKPEEIKEVTIEFPKDQKSSFVIDNTGAKATLRPLKNRTFKLKFSQNILDAYLKDFSNIKAEMIRNDHPERDTILKVTPFMKVKIITENDKAQEFMIYPHLDVINQYYNTKSVNELHARHERFFVESSAGDFFLAQNRFIGKLMRKVDYFYR